MANLFQRLTDGVVVASAHAPQSLHEHFRGKKPPSSFRESFPVALSQRNNLNRNLEVVQERALNYAEELRQRARRGVMSVEVKASVNSLTADEAAAICSYTIEDGPCRALNNLLREENIQQLQPFVDYLWLLVNGLKKCPGPPVPLVYRGVLGSVHGSYNVGSVITWCSFASCTARLETLGGDFYDREEERTEFQITLTTNRARGIGHLSVVPGEDEILLPPNTRLRVMSKANRGHGLWEVQLLEERCLYPIPPEINPKTAASSSWSFFLGLGDSHFTMYILIYTSALIRREIKV